MTFHQPDKRRNHTVAERAVCATMLTFCLAMAACTGKPPQTVFEPVAASIRSTPLWIDTDMVSRSNQTADIDDVLAVRMILNARLAVEGLSTASGNASAAATWESARREFRDLPLHRGRPGTSCRNPAVAGLLKALRQGSLTVLALGSLTNIAQAIRCDRNAASRIDRVVAVAGRRPGEAFRLGEGLWDRELRDLNYETDRDAFRTVLESGVPLHLVPFAAGNQIRLDFADLRTLPDRLRDRAWSWMLILWFVGGGATLPAFDQAAASYLIWPHLFRCSDVSIEAGDDLLLHESMGHRDSTSKVCMPRRASRLKRVLLRLHR
ncbi:MAG: nucleoside hydrolase [Minwuia sp.]|uniref:nucleoside hydrolase n=1 Tax=Minwuia sp. TaxID=2493630 RepID=UPI003A84DFE5